MLINYYYGGSPTPYVETRKFILKDWNEQRDEILHDVQNRTNNLYRVTLTDPMMVTWVKWDSNHLQYFGTNRLAVKV